jgi:hypothetical protein
MTFASTAAGFLSGLQGGSEDQVLRPDGPERLQECLGIPDKRELGREIGR